MSKVKNTQLQKRKHLTSSFYDAVASLDDVVLSKPNSTIYDSDSFGHRYLNEYQKVFGGVPQMWHNVFAYVLSYSEYGSIPLVIANWGYLKSRDELIPLPFVKNPVEIIHPGYGTVNTMTPSQFAVFSGAVVNSHLSFILKDKPSFLKPAHIRGVNWEKCSNWYRGCMNAIYRLAEDDPTWTAVIEQLD